MHLRGKDITSLVLMSLKNRLNKHSNLLKRNASTRHFYNMKCRLCLFPLPHFPLHLWGMFTVMSRHRESRIAFLEEIARVLYPNGEVLMSQTVLDSILESYEEIYDDNHHQFAPDYETLEEGDGFVLGAPHYLHFFFAEDLIAELEASPFQIVNSVSEEREIYMYFKEAKHMRAGRAVGGDPVNTRGGSRSVRRPA